MTVHPSVTLLHSLILSGVEWEKSCIHCPLSPKGRGSVPPAKLTLKILVVTDRLPLLMKLFVLVPF